MLLLKRNSGKNEPANRKHSARQQNFVLGLLYGEKLS
jgi:hypothetical protein